MNRFVTAALIALYPAAMLLGIMAEKQINAERLEKQWDEVVIVQDGTMVANPAYYIENPSELAGAKIISVRSAAIEKAVGDPFADNPRPLQPLSVD